MSTQNKFRIKDVICHAEQVLQSSNFESINNKNNIDSAITLIKDSIINLQNRFDVVNKYIGNAPYSWVFLPNFCELEVSKVTQIVLEYPDGEIVHTSLIY